MNETSTPELVPSSFEPVAREVDPGACFDWLRRGWLSFMAYPSIWIGAAVLLLVMFMAVSIVPIFGQIAAHLLAPVLGAGMFRICQRITDGEVPEIPDLFIGFKTHVSDLVMVGVNFAFGMFGVAVFVFLMVRFGLIGDTVTARIAGFSVSFSTMPLAGLVVIALSSPVIMATWFAPALVIFHDMKPVPAMKASFKAGARNLLPMLIFAIFLVVALFFAMLPVFLGLILFLPVFSGAVYASYRDIHFGS